MIKYITLLMLHIGILSVEGQNTVILEASKDTYINTVIPDLNQGQVQSIIAAGWTYGGANGIGRSLLGFDLCSIPNGFTLVSATLHLYHDYSGSHIGHTNNGLNRASLYETTSYWDEATTWTNQPSYDLNSFAFLSSSNSTTQNYSIDVTSIVRGSILTNNDVGFYLKLDQEQPYRSLSFASKDHPDSTVRPKLELVYYSNSNWCNYPTVETNDFPSSCDNQFVVPNIFSPNGDSNNDTFSIQTECVSNSFQIEVINRWGQVVFKSDSQKFLWNGKHSNSGLELSEGIYFYRIFATYDQEKVSKSGLITLIR